MNIQTFNSYAELMAEAPNIKTSCILQNLKFEKMKDTTLKINLNYDLGINVILDLNLELFGNSFIELEGSNYTIKNLIYKPNRLRG